MKVVRVALLLMLLSTLGLSGSNGSNHLIRLVRRSRGGFQGCGQNLIAALNLVCDKMFAKRNFLAGYDAEERGDDEQGKEFKDGLGGGLWRARSQAIGTFNRVRRGVVNECCEKECSLGELRSYCLVPSSAELG